MGWIQTLRLDSERVTEGGSRSHKTHVKALEAAGDQIETRRHT